MNSHKSNFTLNRIRVGDGKPLLVPKPLQTKNEGLRSNFRELNREQFSRKKSVVKR